MPTETIDPRFIDIDTWPTESAVEAMLEGQLAAIACLKNQTRPIADASEAAAARLKRGGRLIYAGAGTSGRIAVQDGVELSPTYNWPQDRLVFLMAGGPDALTQSSEGAEDDSIAGRAALTGAGATERDVVIGVAASGTTPFTLAVVEAARAAGALTIGIANNPDAPLLSAADHALLADTGSELVAGSTRMKAGTAQKAILNMFSTATMLRCGLIYRGLMVNMRVSNDKLLMRGITMVGDIAGVDPKTAERALEEAGMEIKRAVLIALGAERTAADELLEDEQDDLRAAMNTWRAQGATDA